MGKHQKTSLLTRMVSVLDKYRNRALIAAAVTLGATTILAEFFPVIGDYLSQSNIVELLTLIVVIDIARTLGTQRAEARIRSYENQDDSMPELLDAARGSRTADLIEYAGSTTLPLIRELERAGAKIRILVKHPDTVEGLQKQRCIAALDTILSSVFANSRDRVEVRCYQLPYTLRGRHFHGRLLEVGWLTPDYKRQMAFGHHNSSITVELPNVEHEHFRDFFVRTFDTYWSHPQTVDASDVLRAAEQKQPPALSDLTVELTAPEMNKD